MLMIVMLPKRRVYVLHLMQIEAISSGAIALIEGMGIEWCCTHTRGICLSKERESRHTITFVDYLRYGDLELTCALIQT